MTGSGRYKIVSDLKLNRRAVMKGLAALGASVGGGGLASGLQAAQSMSFATGTKLDWHGFDRYDFLMDDATLEICPFNASPLERTGTAAPPAGHHRCILVVPAKAAKGNPWSWRGVYWDHQPQIEIELLRRGFHIAYISADTTLKPDREWDTWYRYLTVTRGLSQKPAFVGMSRGGEYSYIWATSNPDKVCCIYADNPAMSRGAFLRLGELAWADVPLLQVCGSIDPLLEHNALAIEEIYRQFGGRISMMIKEGYGHHPHSLRDPKPIADFIEQSVNRIPAVPPKYVPAAHAKTYFYGGEGFCREVPAEGTYITFRGPQFAPYYEQYDFLLPHIEGPIAVVAPARPAAGMPWVFRCGAMNRAAVVDLALLAEGFHVVIAPVGYNNDGPVAEDWSKLYEYLTAHGFSAKPVLEGARSAAGEMYAWAEVNPDRVACIYGENPILHSNLAKVQPLDGIDLLALAKIPLMHKCTEGDAHFHYTQLAAARYRQLGGHIEVIVEANAAHCTTLPSNAERVLGFMLRAARVS